MIIPPIAWRQPSLPCLRPPVAASRPAAAQAERGTCVPRVVERRRGGPRATSMLLAPAVEGVRPARVRARRRTARRRRARLRAVRRGHQGERSGDRPVAASSSRRPRPEPLRRAGMTVCAADAGAAAAVVPAGVQRVLRREGRGTCLVDGATLFLWRGTTPKGTILKAFPCVPPPGAIASPK